MVKPIGWLLIGLLAQPLMAQDYIGEGTSYAQQGEYTKALEAYDRALKLNVSPAALTGRGGAKLFLGDRQGALADFNRAIELDPNFPDAYNNRGAIKETIGDIAGAIADLQKAADLFQKQGEEQLAVRLRAAVQKMKQ